jgi:hypothetical protein
MKGGVVLLRSILPIAYSPRLQPGDRLYLVAPPPPVPIQGRAMCGIASVQKLQQKLIRFSGHLDPFR